MVEAWNTLSEAARAPYTLLGGQDKARHQLELEAYNYRWGWMRARGPEKRARVHGLMQGFDLAVFASCHIFWAQDTR